jgi:hypothetical protein
MTQHDSTAQRSMSLGGLFAAGATQPHNHQQLNHDPIVQHHSTKTAQAVEKLCYNSHNCL